MANWFPDLFHISMLWTLIIIIAITAITVLFVLYLLKNRIENF